MHTAYIGIGSNLGNRRENCEESIRRLAVAKGIKIIKRSSMMESEPWGVKEQPAFINMVVKVATDHTPSSLLGVLKKIEQAAGRTLGRRWGPRIIDLDILLYDNLIVKTPSLEIPHRRMCERGFVLIPLAEIAPDKVHPVLKKKISELLAELPET